MIRNYLLVAWRNLAKHKTYAFINLMGLGIAVACCLLIGLFVKHEWSYDRFHTQSDRLYRSWVLETYQKETFQDIVTPYPLGPSLAGTYPEIEAMTRVESISANVRRGDEVFNESVHLADRDFFRMFDFPLLQTTGGNPLLQRNQVVLTEAMARKYFGEENPLGKTLRMQIDSTMEPFTVAAIAQNPPAESSIRFSMLIAFDHIQGLRSDRQLKNWFNVSVETYVLLREGVKPGALEAKFPTMVKTVLGERYTPGNYVVHLQPMTDIHLNNALPAGIEPISDPAYSYILATIALFILVIACINFMTLSIGRSANRAREVGVRKVMGAIREQLIGQFWGEAILMTLLAVLLGLGLTALLLPFFNRMAEQSLSLQFDPVTLLLLFALIVVVGLIAGSYPALVLSSFRPVEVLKGKLNLKGDRNWFRRGMVVIQFGLSVFLIVGTLVMHEQLDYLQRKPLGYQTNRTLVIPVAQGGAEGRQLIERYHNELRSRREVESLTASAFPFASGEWGEGGFTDDQGKYREFRFNMVDEDFIPTYRIKLQQGRNFDRNNTADQFQSYIVNEAFVKAFGLNDPLNNRLSGKFPPHRIIGVTEDFHYQSLHSEVAPLLIVLRPDSLFRGLENVNFQSSPRPDISVRLAAGSLPAQVALLEQAWKKIAPNEPFSYTFLDSNLENQYRQEVLLGRIVSIASGLSIGIACLGLFGLATLAVTRRTKEIGVRKVLGASVIDIVALLSKDFVVLILLANLIAWPVAWWALHRWLADFAFRIEISWWVFVVAAGAALLIALLTVSLQSVRAALANPVKSLRTE